MSLDVRSDKGSGVKKGWSALELAEMKTGRYLGPILRPKGFSSRLRLKPEVGAAVFHVMSRTTNGDFLFGPTEKEAFRRMMWRMATFAGVEVLTYAVMDNHFHILVRVPEQAKWVRRFEDKEGEEAGAGEARLLGHLSTLYSKVFLQQLRYELNHFREQGMEEARERLLQKFKDRFCDVSLFVKELKERFSRWYNKQNGRRGTLWMDRFKSVLVDGEEAMATMAAYIDLNPVRAGIVKDPMDYEWSGYGEACAGSKRARRGICKALSHPRHLWETRTLPRYRVFLYDEGFDGSGEDISAEDREAVQAAGGKVGVGQLLRKRVASLSNGVAFGGSEFVRRLAERYQEEMGRQKVREPKETEAGGFVMRE